MFLCTIINKVIIGKVFISIVVVSSKIAMGFSIRILRFS
jgi:hypothetical protein